MSLCCDDFLRHTTRLLRHQGHYKQGYYIKVYQGYYVTMTLTNHRPLQNRPTLDAKKMYFCSSESRLRNKTKLFSTCNWSIDGQLNVKLTKWAN